MAYFDLSKLNLV